MLYGAPATSHSPEMCIGWFFFFCFFFVVVVMRLHHESIHNYNHAYGRDRWGEICGHRSDQMPQMLRSEHRTVQHQWAAILSNLLHVALQHSTWWCLARADQSLMMPCWCCSVSHRFCLFVAEEGVCTRGRYFVCQVLLWQITEQLNKLILQWLYNPSDERPAPTLFDCGCRGQYLFCSAGLVNLA